MTPFSNLGRTPTDFEWKELRAWLKDNPDQRSHLGDKRPDGKCFIGYDRHSRGGEIWASEERVIDCRERARINYARRKNADPEYLKTLLQRRKVQREANSELRLRDNESKRRWNKAHPEVDAAGRGRRQVVRRAKTTDLIHPDLDHSAAERIYAEAANLCRSTGIRHHVDHIIPITYGGWHHQQNLQILPHSVNMSKSNNPFWEHPDFKSWRSVPSELWPSALAPAYTALLAVPPVYLFSYFPALKRNRSAQEAA